MVCNESLRDNVKYWSLWREEGGREKGETAVTHKRPIHVSQRAHGRNRMSNGAQCSGQANFTLQTLYEYIYFCMACPPYVAL